MDKKEELEKLIETKCAKCSKDGKPNMWCWDLPWCHCDIKSLREMIEGKCETPISIKEHIDSLLK